MPLDTMPVYKRFVVVGFLVYALGMFMLVVGALILGDAGFAVFALILTAIPVILAAVAWRFGWRTSVGLAVVAVLGWVLGTGPFVGDAIENPDSVFDFAPAVVTLIGALTVVAGAVMAVMQRAAEPRYAPSETEGRLLLAPIVLAGAAIVISGILTIAGRSSVSDAEAAGAVVVEMKKTEFEPEEIRGMGDAKILVKNTDPFVHTFTIEALDVNEVVKPGSEKLITLTGKPRGTAEVKCLISGHEDMKARLTLQ